MPHTHDPEEAPRRKRGGPKTTLIRGAGPKPKPLGLVWIKSDAYPTLALGLGNALRTHAHIHLGQQPPSEVPPSFLILGPERAEDFVSELEHLKTLNPEAKMLVFSMHPDLQLARDALQAGASGLIHLGLRPEQVVRALSMAHKGEMVFPRDLLKEALQEEPEADLSSLTARQREALELVVKRYTNRQIAKHLFLSESTVKQDLRHAYKVLGVENRTQAARLFRRCVRKEMS